MSEVVGRRSEERRVSKVLAGSPAADFVPGRITLADSPILKDGVDFRFLIIVSRHGNYMELTNSVHASNMASRHFLCTYLEPSGMAAD